MFWSSCWSFVSYLYFKPSSHYRIFFIRSSFLVPLLEQDKHNWSNMQGPCLQDTIVLKSRLHLSSDRRKKVANINPVQLSNTILIKLMPSHDETDPVKIIQCHINESLYSLNHRDMCYQMLLFQLRLQFVHKIVNALTTPPIRRINLAGVQSALLGDVSVLSRVSSDDSTYYFSVFYKDCVPSVTPPMWFWKPIKIQL